MPVQYLLLSLQKTFASGGLQKVDRESLQTSYGFPPNKGDANMDFDSTSPWGSRWKKTQKKTPHLQFATARPMLGTSESKIFPTARDAEDLWLTQANSDQIMKGFSRDVAVIFFSPWKKDIQGHLAWQTS